MLLRLQREDPIAQLVDGEPEVIGQRREPPEDRYSVSRYSSTVFSSSTEIGICRRLFALAENGDGPAVEVEVAESHPAKRAFSRSLVARRSGT